MRERKRNSVEVYSGVCTPYRTQIMQFYGYHFLIKKLQLSVSSFMISAIKSWYLKYIKKLFNYTLLSVFLRHKIQIQN